MIPLQPSMSSIPDQLDQMYQRNSVALKQFGADGHFQAMTQKVRECINSGNISDAWEATAHYLLAANQAVMTDQNRAILNQLPGVQPWFGNIQTVLKRMVEPSFDLKKELKELVLGTRPIVTALNKQIYYSNQQPKKPTPKVDFTAHINAITGDFFPSGV